MAQIDRIQVKSVTYNVAQAAEATFAGTSGDASTATSWTDVEVLASGETNASIFTKISKMFKNTRFLYTKLGNTDFSGTGQTTVTDALANLGTNHSHTVSQLPVSSQQINSSDYIPTSDLIYSMNETLTSLNDAKHPNFRFEEKYLGTWSSLSQVDTFFSTYTHANNYSGLSLGNYVTIQDGTYNVDWMIAGFDTEYQKGDTASGYGITMIPRTYVTNARMNSSHTTSGGYASSEMHTTTLPAIATKLQTVLGSHLLSRRVLLSNATSNVASSGYCGWTGASSGSNWYSSYLTLMTESQVYGAPVFSSSAFDTGEGYNKLPIFNFIKFNEYELFAFWLRGVTRSSSFANASVIGHPSAGLAGDSIGVRPLMYLN